MDMFSNIAVGRNIRILKRRMERSIVQTNCLVGIFIHEKAIFAKIHLFQRADIHL